jgi:hypothetical protein
MLYDPTRWHVTNPIVPKFQDKWRKILWDAANLIETAGWIQGHHRSEHGYCILGAINAVDGRRLGPAREAKQKLRAFLRRSFMSWNDDRRRTKEEVLAALRTVALSP